MPILTLSFVNTKIQTANANAVQYTVGGLAAGDTGIVTFTDSLGSTVIATVTVNGAASVDLSSLIYGTVTASMQVGVFPPVAASNTALLDQDLYDDVQAGLQVTAGIPFAPGNASSVAFSVAGLQPDDTGTVTFTDGNPAHQVVITIIGGVPQATTVNLSALTSGQITSVLTLNTDPSGNTFAPVTTVYPSQTLSLNATTMTDSVLTNSGTVDATGGATSTLNSVIANDTGGTVKVDAGSTLDLTTSTIGGGTLTNSGTVDVSGGTSRLNGTSVTDSGGTVKVDTSSTLDLNAATIAGGTLNNSGTVDVTGGATSTLNGITIANAGGAGTSAGVLALDGNGFANKSTSTTSANVTLTSSKANDVIILDIVQNGTSVNTVSDTAGLTWQFRAVAGGAPFTIYEYYAIAPNALSADNITVNFAGTAAYVDLNAFAVSGANTLAPFDTNASSPATPIASAGSITTSNANDLIIAGYRFGRTANPGAGPGWTAINASGGYYMSEYQVVSATQAGLIATASASDETGGIVDALVQAPASAPTPAGVLTVDAGSTLDLNAATIINGMLTNSGTVDATGGTTSTLNGTSVTNTGAVTVDAGSTLDLNATTITGGTLGNSGTVDVGGATSTLTGVGVANTSATVTVDTGSTLDLNATTITGGTLTNSGTVDVTGGGTSTLTGASITNMAGAGAAINSMSLDGNAFANKSIPTTSANVKLTTSSANDVVVLDVVQNGTAVSLVSDAAGLVWHLRAVAGTAPQTIYEYYAIAPNALLADTITVNFVGTASYVDLNAFAVSGANTLAPFDANASSPATPNASTGSITTNNATDFIFAGYRFGGTGAPTAGAGWTAINASGGYYMSEYQAVSATQAGLIATASASDQTGGIVDAIVQAPTAAITGGLKVDAGSMLDLTASTISGGKLINSGTVDVGGGTASTLNGTNVTNTSATVTVDADSTLDLNATTITGGKLINSGIVDVTGGATSTLNGVTIANAGGAGIGGALALDGNGFANVPTSTTSANVILTSSQANDVIILDILQNGTTVNTVSDTAGLVWHQRAVAGTAPFTIYEYYAIAPNALSADNITVNFAGTSTYVDLNAFAVSGANTLVPFDTNASSPATPAASTGSITTSNANDFIFAGYRFGAAATPTAGAGWTAINASGDFYMSEYQIVSATQAGLVANASSADQTGGIVDAIVKAPGAPGALTVDAGSTLDLNATAITGGVLNNFGTVDATGGATSTLNSVIVNDTGGTVKVDAGSTLDLTTSTIGGGALTNSGTVDVSGGTSTLNGTSVTDSGGTVKVDTSSTLDLNAATIAGGTLSNSGIVDVTGGTTSTLNGVTIANAGGAGMGAGVLALDGNGFANKSTSTTSANVFLTSSQANDVIILDIVQNGTSVNTVSDTAGLTWQFRAVAGGAPFTIYEYYAIAPNALSADNITVNFAGTAAYVDLNAFAVSGANTLAPFDTNASSPATPIASAGSITTSNANDLILAGYRFGGTANPGAGPGWTTINASGDYYLSEYKIVSATQAGLTATASASDQTGGIVDAIAQAPAAPPTAGLLTVDAGSTLDLTSATVIGGTLTNSGTVDTTGGTTSTLKGTSVTNTGAVTVDAGSTLDLNATTITGGTLGNSGTVDVTGGTTSTFNGTSVTDSGGTVKVDTSSTLDLKAATITGGTLSNSGTVDVTGGTTSTLIGASFTNTAGAVMAAGPLALDGSGFANFASNQTSSSVKLTTSSANDVIVLDVVQNGTAVSLVSDTAGLVWHQRAVAGMAPYTINEYYAIAPSALSADTITVNFAGTASYVDLNAFAVSGANTLAPFDANASSPATPIASTGSVTTNNANDLIFAGYRFGGTANPGAGAGWTAINASGGYYMSEYQVVSATQAGLIATASASDESGGIVDAIVQASATAVTGGLTVDAGSTLDLNAATITNGTLTNSGTVDATGGTTSTLNGISVTNTGAVTVDAGSTLDLNATTITGGTLTNSGTVDATGGTISTFNGTSATNTSATVAVDAGSTLDLNATTITGGTLTNSGTVDVTGGTTSTFNGVNGTGGTVKVDAGSTLDLTTSTIGGGTLTIAGIVESTGASALNGVAVTNSGLLEAAGGTSTLNGTSVTDSGGTVKVDTSATLDLNAATIAGGTLSNSGTVDVTGGTTSTLNGVTIANAGGAGTSAGVLALDGNGFANKSTPTTSANVTLTSSKANDVIILDIVQNGTTVNTVSDTAGLTWQLRAVAGTAPQTIYEYYAIAPNALSADNITVNFAGPAAYLDLNAFAVSGANTLAPFDANASSPATPIASEGSITTSNANDLILAGYRFGGTANPGAGPGWTAINASGGYYMSEYQVVSATQAGLIATASTPDETGGIVDALVQAPASAPTPPGVLTVDAGSTLDLNAATIINGTLTNFGTVDATGGTTSTLNGTGVTNTGATVAVDAGSTLDLNATTITGGTMTNSGTVDVSGATSTLTGVGVVNTSATVAVDTGSTLGLNATTITGGTLNNAGTVDVTGGGTSTLTGASIANIAGAATLTGSLTLDGNSFSTNSTSVILTTSKTNDLIVLDIVQNGTAVTSVTDAAGLVWHMRAVAGTAPNTIYEYYAVAPTTLSGDTITAHFAGAPGYLDLNAFAVNGANTSAPFDTNPSDPATAASGTASITTSNANDLIVAGYRFGGTASPTAGAGWTAINASGGYYMSEYKVVSATQAGLVATASASDENGGIVDAIVQATTPATTGGLTVDAGSTLNLNNTTIANGTLSNSGTVDSTGTSALNGVTVTNSGLLEVTGGQLTINTAVTNNGNLLANGGTLDITGAVTGSGTATISGTGSVLELGAASAESTTFSAGAVGVLKLDNASAFTGTVAGLATGDSIDLTNFLFSGNPIISGVTGSGNAGTTTNVSVQDGALNVTLHLLNQVANQFAVNLAAYTLTADNATPNHGTLFQLAAPV